MKHVRSIIAITLMNSLAGAVSAADYNVVRNVHLDTPSTEVWRVIGDFCDVDDWHPDVTACRLKVIDGGLHRVLTTADGVEFVERRIASEAGLSYTYRLVSGPLPVENYTATLSIEAGDATRISWSARFASEDPAMEQAVTGLIDKGLAAIESRFGAE